jgi:predicted nucleic acid-binding protein
MIGIDTNVIVRLLTRDDPEQFDAAVRLVKASGPDRQLFVNPIVVAETIWVLERIYKTDRATARKQVAGCSTRWKSRCRRPCRWAVGASG